MSDTQSRQLDHLIYEMTLPFTPEEQQLFGDLCGKMANDKEFKNQYTSHIKSLYVHNFKAIKDGTYKSLSFTKINRKIISAIEKQEKPELTIDPSDYPPTQTETLARIKSIKSAKFK